MGYIMSEQNTNNNEKPFTTVSRGRQNHNHNHNHSHRYGHNQHHNHDHDYSQKNNYSQRRKDLLEQVASGKLDPEKAEKLLSNNSNRTITFSVTRNGALAMYGLQNHRPVVFYLDQWTRLIKFIRTTDVFDKFVEENNDALKSRKNRGKQFSTNYEPKDFENKNKNKNKNKNNKNNKNNDNKEE